MYIVIQRHTHTRVRPNIHCIHSMRAYKQKLIKQELHYVYRIHGWLDDRPQTHMPSGTIKSHAFIPLCIYR